MIRDGVRRAVLEASGDRRAAHGRFFAWLAEDDERKQELVREYHKKAGVGPTLGRLIDQAIANVGADVDGSLAALYESLDSRENPESAALVVDELSTGLSDFLDELFTEEVEAYRRRQT